jgi:hypothetical protein
MFKSVLHFQIDGKICSGGMENLSGIFALRRFLGRFENIIN